MSHTKKPCNPPIGDMANGNVVPVNELDQELNFMGTTSFLSSHQIQDLPTGTPILNDYSLDKFNPSALHATKKNQNEKTASDEQKERGTKYNQNKPRMSLIPARAETEEAHVWTMGEKKYGTNNWKKGIPFSEVLDALHRHYNAYKSGQTLDLESGKSHMAHIRCCCAMLIEFEATRPDLDDR